MYAYNLEQCGRTAYSSVGLAISMEQSPSWESNSSSADQDILLYRTRRFITVFTTSRHWSLPWAIWTQSTISHSILNTHSIIFPSTPWSSEWSFPSRSYDQNFVWVSNLSHSCYMPRPSHPPLFHHHNNIWRSSLLCSLLQDMSAKRTHNFKKKNHQWETSHMAMSSPQHCSVRYVCKVGQEGVTLHFSARFMPESSKRILIKCFSAGRGGGCPILKPFERI